MTNTNFDHPGTAVPGGNVLPCVQSPQHRLDGGSAHHAMPSPPVCDGRASGEGAVRTARILLVEDDRKLAEALEEMLGLAGFNVYATPLGSDAIELARSYRFDMALLDLSLPDISGQDVMQGFRHARPEMPVIILSGAANLDSKLSVFDRGADDYLVKPFQADELVARIHAVLRRARAGSPTELTIGRMTMDLAARRVVIDGIAVPLTGKEYACLEYLVSRRGMTVTKEMFLAHLYGGRNEPEMKIIDVFVCKLRRKLKEAGVPKMIETVWGRGYTIPSAH